MKNNDSIKGITIFQKEIRIRKIGLFEEMKLYRIGEYFLSCIRTQMKEKEMWNTVTKNYVKQNIKYLGIEITKDKKDLEYNNIHPRIKK